MMRLLDLHCFLNNLSDFLTLPSDTPRLFLVCIPTRYHEKTLLILLNRVATGSDVSRAPYLKDIVPANSTQEDKSLIGRANNSPLLDAINAQPCVLLTLCFACRVFERALEQGYCVSVFTLQPLFPFLTSSVVYQSQVTRDIIIATFSTCTRSYEHIA